MSTTSPAATATAESRERFPRGRVATILVALAAVVLALVLVFAEANGVPAEELTSDPSSVGGLEVYAGLLSVLGSMLWGGMAAVCLLAGGVLRSTDPSSRGALFLFATGALFLVLGVDDAALIHENVAPGTFRIPEQLVLAAYLAMVLAWVVAFRDELRRSKLTLLLCAVPCLGLSLAVDVLDIWRVAEDYFKYVGMFCVAGWAFVEAHRRLRASGAVKAR